MDKYNYGLSTLLYAMCLFRWTDKSLSADLEEKKQITDLGI